MLGINTNVVPSIQGDRVVELLTNLDRSLLE